MVNYILEEIKLIFDWKGALFNFLFIGTLICALHNGEDAGWASPAILGLFTTSLLFLMLFLRVEIEILRGANHWEELLARLAAAGATTGGARHNAAARL